MHKTKTLLAVEALREAILHGRIKPGERLNVDALSQELQMSRTPVREAVRILEAEGIIKNEPHRKVTVAELSAKDAVEVYLLRSVLEGLAVKLAVPRLTAKDTEFMEALHRVTEHAQSQGDRQQLREANADWHMHLYRAAGMQYLLEFIIRLWAAFPWEAIWDIPGRGEESLRQHAEIMIAIRDRDAELASRLMSEHILSGQRAVQQFVGN